MRTSNFPVAPAADVLVARSRGSGGQTKLVIHDDRGHWQFFDGPSLFAPNDLRFVPLADLLRDDPSLLDLADLPRDWQAWRTAADGPWVRESRKTLEATRARSAAALAELWATAVTLPPGSPGSVELIREDRDR